MEDRYQRLVYFLFARKPKVNQCHGAEGFEDMLAMASILADSVEYLSRKPFISPP
jgi:hypothetical protein